METQIRKKEKFKIGFYYFNKQVLVLLFVLFAFGSVGAQTEIYKQDFEKGGKFEKKGKRYQWDGLLNSGNHPTIEEAPQRSGRAGRFYLNKTKTGTTLKNNYRTEVVLTNGRNQFEFGKEYWLNIDYMFSKWEINESYDYSLAPFQIHTTPPDYNTCKLSKGVSSYFPFKMGVKGEMMYFTTYKNKKKWSAPIEKGVWINIIVHFKISPNSDGFIEVWKDGISILDFRGRNTYRTFQDSDLRADMRALKTCIGNMKKTYIKVGVYKGHWKNSADKSISQERELWIDNFKLVTDTSINPFGSTLSNDKFQNDIDIIISPNPTANEINIQFPEAIKVERVSIYDVMGKEVFTKNIEASETKLVLKPNLTKGIYIVKIANEKGIICSKIIIE